MNKTSTTDSFAPLRALFAKPDRTVADLDADLARLDEIEQSALGTLGAAAKTRDDVMADHAPRTKAGDAADVAARELADAGIWRAKLVGEREAVVTAEEDARRKAIYAAASAKLGRPGAYTEAYQKAAHSVLASVRAMAEMSLSITEANAALPAGAVPLADPFQTFGDAARGLLTSGLPREVLSERPVSVWCFENTWSPIGDQNSVTADPGKPGRGYVGANKAGGKLLVSGNIIVEKKDFLETTTLPATVNVWVDQRYAYTGLALPGCYTPPTGAFAPTDAASVVAAIDAALAAETAAPLKRERKVELRPVTANGEVLEAA